jgi:hypothetical protein
MSEQVIEQPVVQTDAEELASAMAGYNKTRGEQPPVEEPKPKTEVAAVETEEVQAVVPVEELPQPDPEPTVVTLADELKALKAKVAAANSDPDAVRKLHGEIGNINRTLKALQAPVKAEAAPADDELAAAIKDAEALAEEMPEIAGPLVKALKASLNRPQPAPVKPEDIDERVTAAVSKARETDAIEALREEHPDFMTVRETPEYKAWLTSKPPEFQERFNTTWNPAVVARGLTEFKESLKARERKQTRLAAAVTPQGVPQKAGPSTLPDEAGFSVGYNKGRKRL